MSENERVHIFSNGFEHDCWEERNCSRCALKPYEGGRGICDIFDAITDSMAEGNQFSPEIAARMGYSDACVGVLGWPCAEFRFEPPEPLTAAQEMARAGATPLFGSQP